LVNFNKNDLGENIMNIEEMIKIQNNESKYEELKEEYFNTEDIDNKIRLLEEMIPIVKEIYEINDNNNTNEVIKSLEFELKNLKSNK
jgi:glycerol-3-phosphate dehydrogenase